MVRGNQRSMRQVSRGNPCDYRAMGQPESRCFLQHLRIFGIGLIRRNAETEMTVCRPHSTSNHYFITSILLYRNCLLYTFDSVFSLSLSHHRHSLPVEFYMQRYSVRTVAKYRCANGSRMFPAAFLKSQIWVFRSIPFTVYWSHCPFPSVYPA